MTKKELKKYKNMRMLDLQRHIKQIKNQTLKNEAIEIFKKRQIEGFRKLQKEYPGKNILDLIRS